MPALRLTPTLRAIFAALALALAAGGPSPAFAVPKALTAEEVYALGLKYLKRGYFTKALEQFNRVRSYFRDDPISLKAELAIADIHYKKNEWDEARVAYEDFMRAHPRYPEIDVVIYRLGMTIYKKAPLIPDRDPTWTRQVVSTWAGYSARFPESEHREEVEKYLLKAQGRLARRELEIAHFYARREAWPAVIGRIDPLLVQWPDTPDRAEALVLLGIAHHRIGQTDAAEATLATLSAEKPGSSEARALQGELRKAVRPPKVRRTG
jgi:outer membrane protein assembly factor BamD